jgi:hypothetical protein
MEVLFKKCEGEFMLLPNFEISKWFYPEQRKYQRVITIGWLFWFVRFY